LYSADTIIILSLNFLSSLDYEQVHFPGNSALTGLTCPSFGSLLDQNSALFMCQSFIRHQFSKYHAPLEAAKPQDNYALVSNTIAQQLV
jgi:hypothetical protein